MTNAGEGITVVKLGGSLLENARLRARALEAVACLFTSGGRVVLVHGGGKRIDESLLRLHIEKRVHEGLRITDAETLDVVVGVLAGQVNKELVAELRSLGVKAAGLSGADGETLWAEFHQRLGGVDLGYVGRVVSSDPSLVTSVLSVGMLPVVASLAIGRDGTLFNVNADSAAAALARSLHAGRLVFFTDVEGLLDAEQRLVTRMSASQTKALLSSSAVSGGMKPKLQACLEAISAGVPEVVIAGPGRHESVLRDGKGGTSLVAA
jgi:acetylglutamate kinase